MDRSGEGRTFVVNIGPSPIQLAARRRAVGLGTCFLEVLFWSLKWVKRSMGGGKWHYPYIGSRSNFLDSFPIGLSLKK